MESGSRPQTVKFGDQCHISWLMAVRGIAVFHSFSQTRMWPRSPSCFLPFAFFPKFLSSAHFNLKPYFQNACPSLVMDCSCVQVQHDTSHLDREYGWWESWNGLCSLKMPKKMSVPNLSSQWSRTAMRSHINTLHFVNPRAPLISILFHCR